MRNSSTKLSEQILSNLLSFAIYPAILLRQRLLLQIFEIPFDEVIDLFFSHIALLLEVPSCNLAQVCHFKDEVQIVMIIVVNHLVQLGDVWMIQLRPELNLCVHLV